MHMLRGCNMCTRVARPDRDDPWAGAEQCLDCGGLREPNASAPGGQWRSVDRCGTCDANVTNDCAQDCAGVWGGGAARHACGVCNAKHVVSAVDNVSRWTEIYRDEAACWEWGCGGVQWSGAEGEVDRCGVCGGAGAACLDCLGQPHGLRARDHCGKCDAGLAMQSPTHKTSDFDSAK